MTADTPNPAPEPQPETPPPAELAQPELERPASDDKPLHRARDGSVYEVTEPLRPDLQPGETVTVKPDRYCMACEQARGGRRCSICGGLTIRNEIDAGEPLERPAPKRVSSRTVAQAFEDASDRIDVHVDGGEPVSSQWAYPASVDVRDPRDNPSIMRARPYVREVAPLERSARQSFRERHYDRPSPRRSDMPNPTRHVPRREYDEENREIHYSNSRRRQRTPMDELDDLWAKAKVDKTAWCAFAAGFASQGMTPADAADAADNLYGELIAREQIATHRSAANGR